MEIVFTKGRTWVSKLICWALESEMSHAVIVKDGLVYHSNMRGLHIQPLGKFTESSRIIDSVDLPDSPKLLEVMERHWRTPYDYRAFLWLGVRAVMKKVGVRLPKADARQITGLYICTEFITEVLSGEEQQLTPEQLRDMLKGK